MALDTQTKTDRSPCEQHDATHLDGAEGRKDIFSDAALAEIFRVSAGAPRAILKVCFIRCSALSSG